VRESCDVPKKFFVRSEYFLLVIMASTASAGKTDKDMHTNTIQCN